MRFRSSTSAQDASRQQVHLIFYWCDCLAPHLLTTNLRNVYNINIYIYMQKYCKIKILGFSIPTSGGPLRHPHVPVLLRRIGLNGVCLRASRGLLLLLCLISQEISFRSGMVSANKLIKLQASNPKMRTVDFSKHHRPPAMTLSTYFSKPETESKSGLHLLLSYQPRH